MEQMWTSPDRVGSTIIMKSKATPAPLRALGAAADVVTDFLMAGLSFIVISADDKTRWIVDYFTFKL